jgi:ATP-dependent DNA helicase PIF1
LTGRWSWLFGSQPTDKVSARRSETIPPPREVNSDFATIATTAGPVSTAPVRTLGQFNRDLPPAVAPASSGPEFKRDSAYESSRGVRKALAAIDAIEPIVLIVGRAGTGKTVLVRYLRGRPGSERQAVVAPTGVAALNTQAQTIHSFFQFPFGVLDHREVPPFRSSVQLLRRMNRLVIDEVSMVRADILDSIDARLRNVRADDRPFGGVQVVLVGDFLQLPPVAKAEEFGLLQGLGYRSPHLFSSRVLENAPVSVIEFDQVHRQSETEFVELLAKIRMGDDLEDAVGILNERCARPHRERAKPILLTPTRAAAEHYNQGGLDAIPDEPVAFDAKIEGTLNIQTDQLPVPERLELKVGARVMAAKNDPGRRWVNGSLGTVTSLGEDDVGVLFDHDPNEYRIGRAVWEKQRQEWDDTRQRIKSKRVAAYSQIPLLPAWAITIHKSQGLSLDDVRVDLGRGAFASGQVYVALSRAKTLSGLSLTRKIRAGEIKTDLMLLEFVGWLRDR